MSAILGTYQNNHGQLDAESLHLLQITLFDLIDYPTDVKGEDKVTNWAQNEANSTKDHGAALLFWVM